MIKDDGVFHLAVVTSPLQFEDDPIMGLQVNAVRRMGVGLRLHHPLRGMATVSQCQRNRMIPAGIRAALQLQKLRTSIWQGIMPSGKRFNAYH